MSWTATFTREGDHVVAHCGEVDVTAEGRTVEEARDNLVAALAEHFNDDATTGDAAHPGGVRAAEGGDVEVSRPDDYERRTARDRFGDTGTALVADLARQVTARGLLPALRQADVEQLLDVGFTDEPEQWMIVTFDGVPRYPAWDGTLEDAQAAIEWLVRDIGGQIKEERGRAGGRHPWDA